MAQDFYALRTHRHRFACWTAGRAVARNFSSAEHVNSAIEAAGLAEAVEAHTSFANQVACDAWHDKACHTSLEHWQHCADSVNASSYGRAAKVVAIFSKLPSGCQPPGRTACGAISTRPSTASCSTTCERSSVKPFDCLRAAAQNPGRTAAGRPTDARHQKLCSIATHTHAFTTLPQIGLPDLPSPSRHNTNLPIPRRMQKTILITGCSSGFGESLAPHLARQGHRVYATMRSPDAKNAAPARSLRELASTEALELHVLDLDVTDEASVAAAATRVLAEPGGIDVIVNNAGQMFGGITEAFTAAEFARQLDINVLGVHRVTRAVLPAMRAAGSGLLINVSSTAGRCALPFFGVYHASKFALEGYTQALRLELAQAGVDAVLVEPGPFTTNLFLAWRPLPRRRLMRPTTQWPS